MFDVFFFLWRRAPQQMLRMQRSLKASCDEDKEKDDWFFSFFQVMEQRWKEIDRGKPKYSGKNVVHHKSHMD
jgi:hypothetical protein